LLDQQEQALRQTPAGYDSPGADPVIRDYDAVGGQYQSFYQFSSVKQVIFNLFCVCRKNIGIYGNQSVDFS
jgi:hypothetical protein